jgi:hypothetical protein
VNIPVRFSSHAQEKILSRNVKISDAFATISTPDDIYEDVERGALIAIKKVNGNPSSLFTKWRTTELKL